MRHRNLFDRNDLFMPEDAAELIRTAFAGGLPSPAGRASYALVTVNRHDDELVIVGVNGVPVRHSFEEVYGALLTLRTTGRWHPTKPTYVTLKPIITAIALHAGAVPVGPVGHYNLVSPAVAARAAA